MGAHEVAVELNVFIPRTENLESNHTMATFRVYTSQARTKERQAVEAARTHEEAQRESQSPVRVPYCRSSFFYGLGQPDSLIDQWKLPFTEIVEDEEEDPTYIPSDDEAPKRKGKQKSRAKRAISSEAGDERKVKKVRSRQPVATGETSWVQKEILKEMRCCTEIEKSCGQLLGRLATALESTAESLEESQLSTDSECGSTLSDSEQL